MEYEQVNEKVAVTSIGYIPISRPLQMTQDSEIRRTRKGLVIILSILLVSV